MARLHVILGWLAALAVLVAAASWLTMWFTEGTIFSHVPLQCLHYDSIELKGKVFRTCSYLATRYRVGQYGWWGSALVIAIYVPVDRRVRQKAGKE
jgi:lysylphosphatidylglycerol synthetase-like protein (DUF2156 family)